MIHVVLDTNIYRGNPTRDNLHFKALEKLSKAGSLRLHIPYVVLREFQTEQRAIYSKDLAKAMSGLSGLSRKLLDKDVLQKLNATKAKLEAESENILSSAESQIINWADEIGAEPHALCLDQATLALEVYFKGKLPLQSAKSREDITDIFIVRSIYKLNSTINGIHVVAADGEIRDKFSDEETIATYKSLADFIGTKLIQDELKEADLIGNIGPLGAAARTYEDESSDILNFLSGNIGEAIAGKAFSDPSIRDDNHEANVSSYGEAEDINLDFSKISYFGNGQFGIPFDLKIEALGIYHILKQDYYCLDSEYEVVPSVQDHNDHYFQAEEDFELYVSGLVSFTIDRNNINLEDFSKCIVEDSYKIDEISDIRLC